jgi:hypothetical protein
VLKDVFHVFEMFSKRISIRHGGRADFCRDLRDVILVPDAGDVELVKHVRGKKGETNENACRYRPRYVWQRVRRRIQDPIFLYPAVKRVFDVHANVLDDKTKRPLFNDKAMEVAKNVLEMISKGYISDPFDVSLYRKVRTDADGLSVYDCARGTNGLDGGVHRNIHRNFGSWNASPQLTNCLLNTYVFRHNMTVQMSKLQCYFY